jgi:SAM-dependent methyltransferase
VCSPRRQARASMNIPQAASPHHDDLPASGWVTRWAALLPEGSSVLDLACGAGRHARWLAARGHEVLAVDIDGSRFRQVPLGVSLLEADLEATGVWPLAGRVFDAVVVANYLHRERFADLITNVMPGGLLIYETFAQGNERFGKPSNPAYLLAPGELPRHLGDEFEVLGFEDVEVERPRPAVVQRICARRQAA